MLKLYAPRILTFDLANVTLILSTILASKALSGSITAINQSFNLQSVPVGIFAYALASAIFPVLSEQYAENNEPAFIRSLLNTIRQIFYLMLPITVFMIIFRAYIVRLILGSGNFTWQNTITTLTFLGIFSISLLGQSFITLFSRAFYARHNTRVPVTGNLLSIALNIILSVILFKYYNAEGLIISFVVANFFNAIYLFVVLRKILLRDVGLELVTKMQTSLLDSLVKISVASFIAGAISYLALAILGPYINTDRFVGLLIQSSLAGIAGVTTYVFITQLFKLPEARAVMKIFFR